MDNNLTKKRELLIKKQIETEKILQNIKQQILNTNYEISNKCIHKWITEREDGPYGERFTFCEKCRISNYGDYHHY